jgi:tetratricopeptide (TPR) repeat protein
VAIFSLAVANGELNIEYSTLAAARLKFDRGDYVGAISLYNLEIESDELNAESVFERGKCHQFLGNYRQAIADYNHSLFVDFVGGAAQNQNRAEVYYMLGLLHDLVGRQSLAAFNYRRAINLNPNHAEARVSLSFATCSLYRVESIVKDLRVALGLFITQKNYSRARDTIESIGMLSSQLNFTVE